MLPHSDGYIPGLNMPAVDMREVLLPVPHHGFPESLIHGHGNLHSIASVTMQEGARNTWNSLVLPCTQL